MIIPNETVPSFELRIVFEPGKPISVHGPIHDKVLCFGILESAKDAIREHLRRQAEGGVVQARVVPAFNGR